MAAARGQKELGSKAEFEHRFYGIAKESRCGLCCVHFISRKGKILLYLEVNLAQPI